MNTQDFKMENRQMGDSVETSGESVDADQEIVGVPYKDNVYADGWWVWDNQGSMVDGPFDSEDDAEDARDLDAGEWVGEVNGGIRDESYWLA